MKRNTRLVAAIGAAVALVLAPLAAASASPIDTPGPLTRVNVSETLNCEVNYVGHTTSEFFNGTACGTFVAVEGTLYGPAVVPAAGTGQTAWTPVSQTNSGTGTATDPYTLVTEVTGGSLSVRQTDTYAAGDHHYSTDSVVTNNSGADLNITLYHGADCYLGSSDSGYGAYDAISGAVSCLAPDGNGQPSAASRIEQFIPITAGSDYIYGSFSQVWTAIAAKVALPNQLNYPNTLMDNGIALSWTVTIPAGGSLSFAMQTNFSPLDVVPLTSGITVNPTAITLGDETTVTARIENSNLAAQSLDTVTITLPAGLEYVVGSAAGIAEPASSAGQLVFSGAGADVAAEGALQFTFRVQAVAPGDPFAIQLAATVQSRVDVTSSNAQLTVGMGQLSTQLSFTPSTVTVGGQSTLTAGVTNGHGIAITADELVVTLPAGARYVADSADGIAEPTVVGNTLVFAGPIVIAPQSTLPFTLEIESTEAGAQALALSGTSVVANVLGSNASLNVEAVQEQRPTAPALANTGSEFGAPLLGGVAGVMLLLGSALALTAARRKHAHD